MKRDIGALAVTATLLLWYSAGDPAFAQKQRHPESSPFRQSGKYVAARGVNDRSQPAVDGSL